MAKYSEYDLFVITSWATYVGMSMHGSDIYTDETEAMIALEDLLKNLKQMVDSGFKYKVVSLSTYISEYGQQQYHNGKYNE